MIRKANVEAQGDQLNEGDVREYFLKDKEVREDNHIPPTDSVLDMLNAWATVLDDERG